MVAPSRCHQVPSYLKFTWALWCDGDHGYCAQNCTTSHGNTFGPNGYLYILSESFTKRAKSCLLIMFTLTLRQTLSVQLPLSALPHSSREVVHDDSVLSALLRYRLDLWHGHDDNVLCNKLRPGCLQDFLALLNHSLKDLGDRSSWMCSCAYG